MKSLDQRYPNKKGKTEERGETVETADCTRTQEEKH